ncbi:MAG: hypothetical protein HFG52_15935 [Lachnospiraceae bacterium]|nr:hypothetical protein [Lachnospiraceae bacterium]
MMEETKKEIINAVKEELGTEFEVFFTQTSQNNGAEQKSITVIPKGNIRGAGVRIELQFKDDLAEETGIKDMDRKLVDDYMGYHGREPISGLTAGLDKRTILMKVEYQMINAEKNKARLTEMPHERLLDLAAIYRVVLSEDAERKISFEVTHSFCEAYKISEEELDYAARQNMETQGFRAQTMEEFLSGLIGVPKEMVEGGIPLYIIRNRYGNNGAAAMFCSRLFGILAGKLESDLCILPCSVDAWLAS